MALKCNLPPPSVSKGFHHLLLLIYMRYLQSNHLPPCAVNSKAPIVFAFHPKGQHSSVWARSMWKCIKCRVKSRRSRQQDFTCPWSSLRTVVNTLLTNDFLRNHGRSMGTFQPPHAPAPGIPAKDHPEAETARCLGNAIKLLSPRFHSRCLDGPRLGGLNFSSGAWQAVCTRELPRGFLSFRGLRSSQIIACSPKRDVVL